MRRSPNGRQSLADISQQRWAILGDPTLSARHTRRLAELGVRAGAPVFVLLKTVGGGRVIALQHGRVALDHATCRRIPVHAVTPQ
jgi:Fe2+ transport system protein FeoA